MTHETMYPKGDAGDASGVREGPTWQETKRLCRAHVRI